tara:strand:- start:928 stop:1038 length:111 start_codon:yes stop_codon:yes gene_type:complete
MLSVKEVDSIDVFGLYEDGPNNFEAASTEGTETIKD